MSESSQRNITILIVEDHQATLAEVQRLVSEALPACRTLTAGSAERALDLCMDLPAPHVVVMDIGLPEMDGIEATSRIRSAVPQLRVVIHSNHDLPRWRRCGGRRCVRFQAQDRQRTDAGNCAPAFQIVNTTSGVIRNMTQRG